MIDVQPTLTIGIASHGQRVFNLKPDTMVPAPGQDYLICVQGLDTTDFARAEAMFARPDITLFAVQGAGAARNRNAAMTQAKGEILLFADDDLRLLTSHYAALRDAFANDPTLDFTCGQVNEPEGRPRKRYSAPDQPATRFNVGKVGTPELAIRLKRVRAKGVRFEEGFGAGAPIWLGDEYIFLCDALRAGLRGKHIALSLAVHPATSSGDASTDESFLMRKRVIQRALGPLAWPARLAFALRHRKRFADWRSVLAFLLP